MTGLTVLLPPSETKAVGGVAETLKLEKLAFPKLLDARTEIIEAVERSSKDPKALQLFKLGKTQGSLLENNLALNTSATMPAIFRYTGVLYNPIQSALNSELSGSALNPTPQLRVYIQSALLGLISTNDKIPNYRLSFDSKVLPLSLKNFWQAAHQELTSELGDLVLDLRSEGYRNLAPLGSSQETLKLEVYKDNGLGQLKKLNHFNKQGKGEVAARLLSKQPKIGSSSELFDWLLSEGFEISYDSLNSKQKTFSLVVK